MDRESKPGKGNDRKDKERKRADTTGKETKGNEGTVKEYLDILYVFLFWLKLGMLFLRLL